VAVYIDSSGRLHHDQEKPARAALPALRRAGAHHADVDPEYNALQQHKPSQVGLVYRCEACNAPVFLRFPVKLYSGSRVELATQLRGARAPARALQLHVPARGNGNAPEGGFRLLQRGLLQRVRLDVPRVAQRTFADLGEAAKLELYDELANVRRLAEIDDASYETVRKVLFDFDEAGRGNVPSPDAFHAGVLLEVIKDLLYQAYVRRGRLQQAMMVRRYFADDATNVTPLPGAGS
jgi:hypothetical protein